MSPQVGFVRSFRRHPFNPGKDEFPYAWMESPLAARLARLGDIPDWGDMKKWTSGRIFGEAGEYRWEISPDGLFHAVLLLENLAIPEGFSGVTELILEEETGLVLWGRWVDPAVDPQGNPDDGPRFYAEELPRIQTYPVESGGPPQEGETPRLLVRRYRDATGGKGEFLRCVSVKLRRF